MSNCFSFKIKSIFIGKTKDSIVKNCDNIDKATIEAEHPKLNLLIFLIIFKYKYTYFFRLILSFYFKVHNYGKINAFDNR